MTLYFYEKRPADSPRPQAPLPPNVTEHNSFTRYVIKQCFFNSKIYTQMSLEPDHKCLVGTAVHGDDHSLFQATVLKRLKELA